MNASVHGIHHVTAIAGDPQENLNFYAGVMGMRLVKKSVNQDAPDTYHLFYADAAGTPGTDLTFFPWPEMGPARQGTGLAVEVPFAVPRGSLAYWQERLAQRHVTVSPVETRFGEQVLPFTDPHGLALALVETDDERPFVPWADGPVPPVCQLRGMHAVRLWERHLETTEALLTQVMGFKHLGAEEGWRRYGVEGGTSGKLVEVKALPDERRGQWGTGGVHHVAWRVHDTGEQMALRDAILQVGLRPTERIDRFWFESVYFKEPGGTLFELATDGPGFARDEDAAHLGERLILPPWLESHRAGIETALPPLALPQPNP
ncbi:MAG: ring-cleaving dioxygenase [Chloroflexi bacterium]|nr:ring-cleaving dioxygenase [Chloroflexota bacterium]